MVQARYEVRVNGRLSERARSAFHAMNVTSIPTQTIVFGELADPSDLGDLLAQCNAMGLEVLSLRQLPGDAETGPDTSQMEGQDHELAGSAAERRQP